MAIYLFITIILIYWGFTTSDSLVILVAAAWPLLFFLFFLLLLFLLFPLSVLMAVFLSILTSWSVSVSFLFLLLFALLFLNDLKFLDFLLSHAEVSFPSSESSWPPTEQSPSSLVVNDDLGSIDFSVVGTLVGSCEVILVIELNETISSWFSLGISDNPDRFNNTVFLQLWQHLPRIRNSDSFL